MRERGFDPLNGRLAQVSAVCRGKQNIRQSGDGRQVRFALQNGECVLCGLCTRICAEQMDAEAIDFQQRGHKRRISTPFDMRSEVCRLCGACMYVCPACQLRCQGPSADTAICNGCLTMEPTCLDHYDDLQCWMSDAGRCGT